jgi:hypothetical protein
VTTALLLGLFLAGVYVAKRWRDSSAENANLRIQVASLKRQLKQFTRSGPGAR